MDKKPRKTRFVSNAPASVKKPLNETREKEIGGRKQGLDPTRYGDWEFKGRCIDF